MKIDRVILTTNNNPIYYQFWNPLSKLYRENFGIKPTLIFFGTDEELNDINLSKDYGEIIRQDNLTSHNISHTTTWGLFYFTKLYPNDIILINGIDQIPMGTKFLFDYIKDIDDSKYVMLIDDAYKKTQKNKDWSEGGYSPSAYHIAKGETFIKMYEFENDFNDEMNKIMSLNLKLMWDNWGIDEAYSSHVLYHKKDIIDIVNLSKFDDIHYGGRIDCGRNNEAHYDFEKLRNNEYIECHACRPYLNHKNYLDTLFNNIPKFI